MLTIVDVGVHDNGASDDGVRALEPDESVAVRFKTPAGLWINRHKIPKVAELTFGIRVATVLRIEGVVVRSSACSSHTIREITKGVNVNPAARPVGLVRHDASDRDVREGSFLIDERCLLKLKDPHFIRFLGSGRRIHRDEDAVRVKRRRGGRRLAYRQDGDEAGE